jgi:hypothetical protein
MTRLRLGLSLLGLALAIAGLVLENRVLVWAAMAVLGLALVLRLALGRRGPHDMNGG